MADSLSELVDRYDRERTAAKTLGLLRRGEREARRICVQCRRMFDPLADHQAWIGEMERRYGPLRWYGGRYARWSDRKRRWIDLGYRAPETCPACGDALVEVA